MAWYWTHDGRSPQIPAAPFRLARVIAYGTGDRRRFATLVHGDAGAARVVHLDLEASELERVDGAVSVSANEGRFTVVAEPGRPVPSRILAGLDEGGVHKLLAAGSRLLDVDVYETARGPRFAVVAAADGPGTSLLARVGPRPVRIRAHAGRFTVLGGDLRGGRGYTDLTADQAGRRLDRRGAWPVDLDARATPAGVRFAVVLTIGR